MPLIQPASVLLKPQSRWNSGSSAAKLEKPSMPSTEVMQSTATRAPGERSSGDASLAVLIDRYARTARQYGAESPWRAPPRLLQQRPSAGNAASADPADAPPRRARVPTARCPAPGTRRALQEGQHQPRHAEQHEG